MEGPPQLPEVGQTLEVKLIRKTPTAFSGSLRRLDRKGNPYLRLATSTGDGGHEAMVYQVHGARVLVELASGAWGPVTGVDVAQLGVGDLVQVKATTVDPEEGHAEFEVWRPAPSQ